VAASYGEHPGPPVLFARSHFHELMELRGAGGARPLLARHTELLATVDLPELAADLDTAEDYQKFLEAIRKPC
jgi:molybdenum cofactor cytidylyltransferase